MLEHYFIKPDTIERIRGSWLGDAIEQYVTWLTENRYAVRNVHRRVPILMHFAEFSWKHGARAWSDLPDQADPFVAHWVSTRRRKGRSQQAKRLIASAARVPVEQMLKLLLPEFSGHRRIRLPIPFVQAAPEFFAYLSDERGLSEASIELYTHHLRRFEAYLNAIDLKKFSALSPAVLSAFVTHSSQTMGKNALSGLCTHLRIFLRYLHCQQLVSCDLSGSVDCPRLYRLSSIPRSISWDDVGKLLEAVDRRPPIGKRDYAILLLLVTYGLRAREVAALKLDDIDWERERLAVPDRKAGHNTAFPLSAIVGEAILEYLQHGRPESPERAVFLCSMAPYQPIGYPVVSARASHYLCKSGIEVYRPGSHTLRHTCVQRLIAAQLPLKAIGDYIGHAQPKSTEVYTKIDIEGLREVALGDGEAVV